MLLVFLVFSFLIVILFLLILVINVKIDIKKIDVSNELENNKQSIKIKYEIMLGFYIGKHIKLINIEINKNTLQDKKVYNDIIEKMNIKEMELKEYKLDKIIPQMKYLSFCVEKFNFKFNIGTQNSITTSIISAIVSFFISGIIANFITNYNPNKHAFEVTPIYKNQFFLDLHFSCIIYLNLIHIIYMLLKVREVMKNERASNRGSYGNSYG